MYFISQTSGAHSAKLSFSRRIAVHCVPNCLMNRWKAAAQAAVADEKSRMVGKRGGLNLPRVIAGDSSSPAAASASLWMVSRGQIPKELEEDLRREFSEDELERINTRIHRTLAPHNKSPSALFVFGPSAVGKSFLSTRRRPSCLAVQRMLSRLMARTFERSIEGGRRCARMDTRIACCMRRRGRSSKSMQARQKLKVS